MLGSAGKLEVVDRFCYLGDMLSARGGCELACRTRAKCAWGKFMELLPLLARRGVSLKIKGKIYGACVQSVLLYGSQTWGMRVVDLQILERTERMMVRWMCGVTLRDRRSSAELLDLLSVVGVGDMVRRGRLRWFEHVERNMHARANDWFSKCRFLEVDGKRRAGRSRKTWGECVQDDMKQVGLKPEDVSNRGLWRAGILGNRLTRTRVENRR